MCNIKYLISALALISGFENALQAAWSTPSYLSTTQSDQLDLAVNVSGNAVVVWQAYDGTNYSIQYATQTSGGSWSSAETLSTYGINLQAPEVCMDSLGNAVAVWSTYVGTSSIIQSSSLPSGGSWSSAVTISNTGENADSPELGMDSHGLFRNAVAVWHRYNGSNFIAQSASLPAGGSWSSAVNITPSGEDALVPEVVVDSLGNAVMTCCRSDGTNFTTRSATALFGQAWGPNNVISTSGLSASSPVVAVDALGNALTVWSQYDGTNFTIQASYLPFGGSWGTPVVLSTAGNNAYVPYVAMNTAGKAVAVWIGYDGSEYAAQAAYMTSGGTWSSLTTLSPGGYNVGYVAAAIDSSGNATAIWSHDNGSNASIHSSTMPKGGSWGSMLDVSTAGNNAYLPVIGVDSTGNKVAAWLETNVSNINVLATASASP